MQPVALGHATMQPAGAGIVDSVDNLKAYSPQYPQSIVLIAEGAGASATFVGHLDHLDHTFLVATSLQLYIKNSSFKYTL